MTAIPTARTLIFLGFLVLLAAFLGTRWQFPPHDQNRTDSQNVVVATVGTRSITLREIEQSVALSLYHADQQRSQLLRQALQHMIDEELLNAEASRKGVTVSQLLADASQSESIARLANLPAPVKQLSPGKARGSVNLNAARDPQEEARLRQALLVALRRQADIQIDLSEPEPPILAVSADDDPSMGPADAPVTIVEFSDFQCPYCKLSVPVLKELLRTYPDKVKVVYRDYPGPNHPYAQQAAEAAHCADEQGKFWDYHDILFGRQTPGQGWDFAALAKEIGLNQESFTTCLKTRRYREEVINDLRDGRKLGITSTPTFFVNGRPLVGARRIVDFQTLIEMLLIEQPVS